MAYLKIATIASLAMLLSTVANAAVAPPGDILPPPPAPPPVVSSGPGVALANGFGGPEGYGQLSQSRNDDGSSNQLALPFALNFFGTTYSSFFINNNGNVTFGGPVSQYTPSPFPISSRPMIAPFWGDVDTRCGSCGAVYVASPNASTAVATWHDVGYYSSSSNKTNDFQLILSDRSSVAQAGDFDIEFRYHRLQWTTGSASGGSNGLGGTPAQAGYDAGDGVHFFTLPGSRSGAVLDLQNTSNVSIDDPGLWRFAIRNGAISDGSSASNPLLPTVATAAGYQFNFGVVLNQRVFIDPEIAVGYDYRVTSGPNIFSALFPLIPGDADGYDVFGFNAVTSLYDIALGHATAGVDFVFGGAGVSRFGLRGIDGVPPLDPTSPTAFVTGLTFASAGQVSMLQTPFTINVPGAVPEPAAWALMIAGFGMTGMAARRRRPASVLA